MVLGCEDAVTGGGVRRQIDHDPRTIDQRIRSYSSRVVEKEEASQAMTERDPLSQVLLADCEGHKRPAQLRRQLGTKGQRLHPTMPVIRVSRYVFRISGM